MTSSEFWNTDYGEEQATSRGYGIRLPTGFIAKFSDKESRDKTLEAIRAEVSKQEPLMKALKKARRIIEKSDVPLHIAVTREINAALTGTGANFVGRTDTTKGKIK